jgi:hypothetical protein
MITEIKSPEQTTYWIARNKDGSICHHGVIDKGLHLATGQEMVEQFTDEKKYLETLGKYREVTSVDFKAQLAAEVAWVKDVASKRTVKEMDDISSEPLEESDVDKMVEDTRP